MREKFVVFRIVNEWYENNRCSFLIEDRRFDTEKEALKHIEEEMEKYSHIEYFIKKVFTKKNIL